MACWFFIEKNGENDLTEALLENSFRASVFSLDKESFPIRSAVYLRLSDMDESRFKAVLDELGEDPTVNVSGGVETRNGEPTVHGGWETLVLARHNGAFNPMADTVYKLLLLKFPTMTSSLRIREYSVFFVGGAHPKENAEALKKYLLFLGEYREVTEEELAEEVISQLSGDRRAQSISEAENPELTEPFMTVQAEKTMDKYIRTKDEIKQHIAITTRSGATTQFSTTSYSLLEQQLQELDIKMDKEDAVSAQHYFLAESREPTDMELRIINRYRSERWSHSTLHTAIDATAIADGNVATAYEDFIDTCKELGISSQSATLEDIIKAPLRLWAETEDIDLDSTESIKNHSLHRVDDHRMGIGVEAGERKLLVAFAHESNNSRTSIDPAGGASTCLGESVRKLMRMFANPYDSIRISGISKPYDDGLGADAVEGAEEKMASQRSLAISACDSFAEYARATGLPCSANFEYISDNFANKHLEVSAVLASVDLKTVQENKKAEESIRPGDMVMLIGSRTGRDGRVYNRYLKTVTDPLLQRAAQNVGEAENEASAENENTAIAGLEKVEVSELEMDATAESVGGAEGDADASSVRRQRAELVMREQLAARNGVRLYGEAVPSGDASMQKRLMRLCADPEFRSKVKKIRDLDSSGLVTALSALADGVAVYLDCIPLKYNGMTSTEVAFSETCERMVLVVSEAEAANVTAICNKAGVICTGIGLITSDRHLSVYGSGERVAYLSTDFLLKSNSGRRAEARVQEPEALPESEPLRLALKPIEEAPRFQRIFSKPDPDHAMAYEYLAANSKVKTRIRKRRFDNTLGGSSVFSPMGDGFALSAVSYIKTDDGIVKAVSGSGEEEKLCSAVSLGMIPEISDADPFKGAYYAVTEAVGRLVASGYSRRDSHIAIHIFHPSYRLDRVQTGHTLAAILGIYDAQQKLGALSIGGDFSLRGHHNGRTKPSVAVFGIGTGVESRFHSSEFKAKGNRLVLFKPEKGKNGLPLPLSQLDLFDKIESMLSDGSAVSAVSLTGISLAEGVMQMCFGAGGRLGFDFDPDCTPEELYDILYGAIAVEMPEGADIPRGGVSFGRVNERGAIVVKSKAAKRPENDDSPVQGDVVLPLERLFSLCYGKVSTVYSVEPSKEIKERLEAQRPATFTYQGEDCLSKPDDVREDRATSEVTEKYFARLEQDREEAVSWVSKKRSPTQLSFIPLPTVGEKVQIIVPQFNGTVGGELLISALEQKAVKNVEVVPFRCGFDKASIAALAERIRNAGMLCLPDGTDDPAVIAAILKNYDVSRAIKALRKNCGIVYGSGAGFSALIRAGLIGKDVPAGNPADLAGTDLLHPSNGEEFPNAWTALSTVPLTGLVCDSALVRVASSRSPFMQLTKPGEIYRSELSTYNGRFIGNDHLLLRAGGEGMIATQFCDPSGKLSMDSAHNPCGSMHCIESMTSFDGTVFGQISAPERAVISAHSSHSELAPLPIFDSVMAYLSN